MSDGESSARTWREMLAQAAQTYGRVLFGVAFRILRDREAAEDVCQHAFTAACSEISGRVDQQRMVAWLMKVVVNESLRHRRRHSVEARGMRQAAQRAAAGESSAVDVWTREHVWACLDALPDVTRTVVVLRVVQGMSGNEVKDLLGVSAGLVSRHLHQGMDALRVHLADYAPATK